eukprot:gene11040-7673_t
MEPSARSSGVTPRQKLPLNVLSQQRSPHPGPPSRTSASSTHSPVSRDFVANWTPGFLSSAAAPAESSPGRTIDTAGLGELLSLSQVPFRQADGEGSSSARRPGALDDGATGAESIASPSPSAEEEDAVDQAQLLEALAHCDDISDASSVSADMTVGIDTTHRPGGGGGGGGGGVSTSRFPKRDQKSMAHPNTGHAAGREGRTASIDQILARAQAIVAHQPFTGIHPHGGLHYLYLHVHTRIRSRLLEVQSRHGDPTCIAVTPMPAPQANGQGEVPGKKTLDAAVAVAVGTSKGIVLLFDADFQHLATLVSGKTRAAVQTLSIAADRATVVCNINKRLFVWSLACDLRPAPGTLKVYPAHKSAAVLGGPLRMVQHFSTMPYAVLGVEAEGGEVHMMAWKCLFGSPLFFYHHSLVPPSLLSPVTSADTLPYPQAAYFDSTAAAGRGTKNTTALLALLQAQQQAEQSFWSTRPPHLVALASAQGVELLLCTVAPPTMTSVSLSTWGLPRPSAHPILVHLFADQSSAGRHLFLAAGAEGALHVLEIGRDSTGANPLTDGHPELLNSVLFPHAVLPWSPEAAITGLCAAGNGSLLVVDRAREATLIDAVAGVVVERHLLPPHEPLLHPPANCLCGPRAGALPSAVTTSVAASPPTLRVLLCTDELFIVSMTLLTWQERLERMIHHENFVAALEYIRELTLDVSLAVSVPGKRSGAEFQKALSSYLEIVSLAHLEAAIRTGDRILVVGAKNKAVQKAIFTILSFCHHDGMRRVFWFRVMPFIGEVHPDLLPPVMLGVQQAIAGGKIRAVPAHYVGPLVEVLLHAWSGRLQAPDTEGTEATGLLPTPPATVRRLERVLLPLRADIAALFKVGKAHGLDRLVINILAFHHDKYAEALRYALDAVDRRGMDEGEEAAESVETQVISDAIHRDCIALEYLTRVMQGKTFVDGVEIAPEERVAAQREVLYYLFNNPGALTSLLSQDAAATVCLVLEGIWRSSTASSSTISSQVSDARRASKKVVKQKRDVRVHPVRLALRLFAAVIFLDDTPERAAFYAEQRSEKALLELQLLTPLLFKYVCGDAGRDPQSGVSKALRCFCTTLMAQCTLLTEQDNDALGEESNWSWFVGLLGQHAILQHQFAETTAERRQIQHVLSEYFRSPHLQGTPLLLWQKKCHAARMPRCAATICFRDGRFGEAIDYYLDEDTLLEDSSLAKDLFDVLHKEMLSLCMRAASKTRERSRGSGCSNANGMPDDDPDRCVNRLRCAVINRVSPLGRVDKTALAAFYLKYQADCEEDLFRALGGSTQQLLGFLQQLIDSGDEALKANKKLQNQYIELLCREAPHKVYPYLKENDADIVYDRGSAIECSRRHRVYPTTIFLLLVCQRLHDATEYTCEVVEKLLDDVAEDKKKSLASLHGDGKSDPDEEKDAKASLLSQYPLLQQVLVLGVDVGRAANDEPTWMRLVHLFDAAPEPERRSAGGPQFLAEDRALDRWYSRLCDEGLVMVLQGMATSLGSAPLLKTVVQTMKPRRWAPSFPPFLTLLEEEIRMYQAATAIAEVDGQKWSAKFLSATRHGIMVSSPFCFMCHQDLRCRRLGRLVDTSICTFQCGHGFHEACLPVGARRCPECVQHATIEVQLHTTAPAATEMPRDPSDPCRAWEGHQGPHDDIRRVRAVLDKLGQRTSTLRSLLSALPRSASRYPPNDSNAPISGSTPAAPSTGMPVSREDGQDLEDVFHSMTSEDFLRLFGGEQAQHMDSMCSFFFLRCICLSLLIVCLSHHSVFRFFFRCCCCCYFWEQQHPSMKNGNGLFLTHYLRDSAERTDVYVSDNHCHSSSCVEVGDTRVICAVRPPQQLVQEYRGDRGRVVCEVHRVTSAGQRDDETLELDLALALEGVAEQLVMLEDLPQLLIEVTLEIIRDEGAIWDALSTALAVALAAGGFGMLDLFSSCSAALLDDGAVVVDVTRDEEERARASVTVCSSLNSNQIVFMRHCGSVETSTLSQLVHTALSGTQARKEGILKEIRAQKKNIKENIYIYIYIP